MNNQSIALVSLLVISALASFLMLGSSFIHGDALNFANYKLLHASKQYLDLQDYNTYFVSSIYGNKAISFLINIIFLFSAVLLALSIGKGRLRYGILIFVLVNPLWLSRFAEPSREFLVYLFCYFLGVGLVLRDRRLKWISAIVIFLVRPVYCYVVIIWVWLFEKRYKLIILSSTVLIIIVMYTEPLITLYSIYTSKEGDYKGDYNSTFILRLVMNFLGGINSFYQNDNTAEFFLFFLGYAWRIAAIVYIIKRDYVLFVKFCLSTGILLSIVYPFPHPRYLEPAIYVALGILSVKSQPHEPSDSKAQLDSKLSFKRKLLGGL